MRRIAAGIVPVAHFSPAPAPTGRCDHSHAFRGPTLWQPAIRDIPGEYGVDCEIDAGRALQTRAEYERGIISSANPNRI
jgi:hypothetical protein